MRVKVRKAMEEMAAEATWMSWEEQNDLWSILTALRGPDFQEENLIVFLADYNKRKVANDKLKLLTTAVIRGSIPLSRLAKTIGADVNGIGEPQELEHAIQALQETETGSHFSMHIHRAIHAIQAKES